MTGFCLFCIFFETGSHYVGQGGLELALQPQVHDSLPPSILSAGLQTGMCYLVQPLLFIYFLALDAKKIDQFSWREFNF
jgi:hypothetical protein